MRNQASTAAAANTRWVAAAFPGTRGQQPLTAGAVSGLTTSPSPAGALFAAGAHPSGPDIAGSGSQPRAVSLSRRPRRR